MTASKKDYLFYSIVIAFAGFFLMSTTEIQSANKTTILGPKAWPSIILILMLVLAIMGVIKTFITSKKAAVAQVENSEIEEPERRLFNIPFSLVSIFSIILYTVGLYVFGFIISTVLFLYLLTQLLGAKKQLVIILLSVILTAVFVWLFSIVLSVPLPRGIGIFREFSLLFY